MSVFFLSALPKSNNFSLYKGMKQNKGIKGFFPIRQILLRKQEFMFIFYVMFTTVSPGFSECLFNFAEYKFALTATIPDKNTKKEKAVSGNAGVRLSFRDADARAYVTLAKTELGKIRETKGLSQKADLFNEIRYGAGFFLFQKTLPISVKIGQNSYSKSVSKIRNPAPGTTANPLAKTFAFSTGMGASLPTLTSSQQPLSMAISIRNEEIPFPVQISLDGFLTENKEKFSSLSAKYGLSRCVFIQAALSLGEFFIENNATVLKKNYADFKGDFFYSALGELSFFSPIFKINFYSGIQQSPYKSDSWWFRFDGRTSFQAFLLNISYFAIPSSKDSPKAAPLISASSSICRTVEQASVNPQVLFLFDDKNASSLRIGFSALENWKVTATNIPVQLNTMKIRGGIEYENRFFSAQFNWTHANILLSGEPPTKSSRPEEFQTFSVSSSYVGKIAKHSFSGSYSYYPPLPGNGMIKEIYSANLKIAVTGLNLTASTGIDLTYKEHERNTGEFTASISYSRKQKYLRTAIKVSLAMPF